MKREWVRQGNDLLKEIESASPAPGEVLTWYIGQVGFVIKGEVTIAVDPFLNDLTDDSGASLRMYGVPFDPSCLHADYVFCTHGHADHMALPTLRAMADAFADTRFAVPAGCVEELTSAGVAAERIIPLTAHQELLLPGLIVRPVQAAHPVHTVDANGRDLALCFSIRMNDIELLHLGDTYLTDQLLMDLTSLPQPDVLFTPINGGDYFRTARQIIGNLSMEESANLASLLHARLVIPTHFDLIRGNTCDPLAFIRILWEIMPSACFRLPSPGEQVAVRKGCSDACSR